MTPTRKKVQVGRPFDHRKVRFVRTCLVRRLRELGLLPMRSLMLLLPLLAQSCLHIQRPGLARPILARTRTLSRVAAPPKAAAISAAAAAAASAAPAGVAIMPLLQPALRPILFVIAGSAIGMVPSAIKAFWPVRSEAALQQQKLMRRVFTGCMLGVVVSLWIFSGTWCFLSLFGLMAVIAQNEYFLMARRNGCYPTWKLGTLGSVGMYVAACSTNPVLREALFPLTGVLVTVYLMLRRKINPVEAGTPPLTMNDVSTTFLGIYYFGFMPSFWVRLRSLSPLAPSAVLEQLLPPASALWSSPLVAQLAASSVDIFTCGAIIQW